jgi:hydrogenase maturation protease
MGFDTVILGIGNPLMGDDGAGAYVVEQLELRQPAAELVSLDTPSYAMLTYLQGKKRALIVDAAFFNGRPGEVRQAGLGDIETVGTEGALNLHEAGLIKVLRYAQLLELLPDTVSIYCIQAGAVSPGTYLSPAVKAGAEQAVRLIVDELAHA